MSQPFYPTTDGAPPQGVDQSTSVNQQYNQAVSSGKFKGSFAEFMKNIEDKGWLDKGINTIDKIRSWVKGDSETPVAPPAPENDNKFEISGTTKTLLIIGGILVAGLIGYGVYRAVKAGKTGK